MQGQAALARGSLFADISLQAASQAPASYGMLIGSSFITASGTAPAATLSS